VDQKRFPIQLKIFAPWSPPYDDNWVEQVLGDIVRPILRDYSSHIDSVWVTRYINRDPVKGLGQPYLNEQGQWRHVLLRFLVKEEESLSNIKLATERLIRDVNCAIPFGWENYDLVGDLGSDRFIEANANSEDRIERAYFVFRFMDATIRLMLDSIKQDNDKKWHLESNSHEQNPDKSFFQSVHHLFCNATNVPTIATVGDRKSVV